MTLDKSTLSQIAIYVLFASVATLALGWGFKMTIFIVIGGMCGLVVGICVFLWTVTYLRELDERLKRIEGK